MVSARGRAGVTKLGQPVPWSFRFSAFPDGPGFSTRVTSRSSLLTFSALLTRRCCGSVWSSLHRMADAAW